LTNAADRARAQHRANSLDDDRCVDSGARRDLAEWILLEPGETIFGNR